jgi:hypothetical protein
VQIFAKKVCAIAHPGDRSGVLEMEVPEESPLQVKPAQVRDLARVGKKSLETSLFLNPLA